MNNIVEAVSEYARLQPDLTAVSDKNGNLSYRELEEQTDYFAHRLEKCQVQEESFVAVYVTRTCAVMVGALATMKAKAAYMPVDPTYPEERISYMIQDAGCVCVLTEQELWKEKPIAGFNGSVIYLDGMTEEEKTEAKKEASDWKTAHGNDRISSESCAMLLYTSGTTGKPKGVVHTHGSLKAITETFPAELNSKSKVGVFAGFTFLASGICMFSPLFAGGEACIVPEDLKGDLDRLYRFLRKHEITHIFLAPYLGALLAEKQDMQGITMLLGGEKMPLIRSELPLSIINIYGSTEGALVAVYKVKGDETEIPIGAPTDGTEVLIVDEEMNPVKQGKTGELLYTAPYMAKGYYHLPEQTAKKWTEIGGKRYYHTGDRVRMDDARNLWYVGRTDDMVKLHGYRIELGEVENRIAAAGGKDFACAVRNANGTDQMCCFYESGKGFDADKIREAISKELTSYMVPDLWVPMDRLPRNPNGKIVRRELPVPEIRQTEYAAPQNDVDAMIVKHMEELLHIRKIGMNDSYIAMGGDSLTAMNLSSRLRQRGIILSSSDILQAATVSQLCEHAKVQYEQIWDDEEWEHLKKEFLSHGETIQKVLPLTREQEAMLMQQLLYPDDPHQVRFYSFLIDCAPEESQLRTALDQVSDRFECLRTAIIYHNISAIQQVITDRKIPLQVKKAETNGQAEKIASAFWDENNPFSFDLQNTAQIRVLCIHLPEKKSLLLVAVERFLLDEARLRWYFSEFLGNLNRQIPESCELAEWAELLQMGVTEEDKILRSEEADGSYFKKLLKNSIFDSSYANMKPEQPVYTYSSVEGAKKFVFVHTANTGSEAYYNLAKRIKGLYSFAAMEQYNLYHPGQEVYGIKNLAKKYLEILKDYQPEGPYCLGGWCYGGMIAYEMACLLEAAGEEVEIVVMLDSQAAIGKKMKKLYYETQEMVKREYFETCPLFEDMRTRGMLENLICNYQHVKRDVVEYIPSRYHGRVLYFKPEVIPAGSEGAGLIYQKAILTKKAGGYEGFVDSDKLKIVTTPHEHDLMMDDASLDVVVPVLEELNDLKTFYFPAEPKSWDILKSYLMGRESIEKTSRMELCLIAEEIMVNIISYAYPNGTDGKKMIRVSLERDGNLFRMVFTDWGVSFDPRVDPAEKELCDPTAQIGGMGLFLVANMADATYYENKNGENVFRVEKTVILGGKNQ